MKKISVGAKGIWLLCYTVAVFSSNVYLLLTLFATSLLTYILLKTWKTLYHKSLINAIILLLPLVLISLIINPATDNLIALCIFSLRWLTLTITTIIFFAYTTQFEIITIFKKMHISKDIGLAINYGFLFVPIIFEEIPKIYLSQKTRGTPQLSLKNIAKTPKIIASIAVPLLINIVSRTETMYIVEELKPTTSKNESESIFFSASLVDIALIAYSFSVALIALTM